MVRWPEMATSVPSTTSYYRRHREWIDGTSTIIFLGCLYITLSGEMIAFNKYLIHKDRFPFAVPLVLLHAGFSSVCALVLFLAKPSMFPSLADPVKKVSIDKDLVLRGALPIAVCFSVQLVLSNTAYLHSSMVFLQMMKESNLIIVYFLSVMAALEIFTSVKLKIIIAIMLATSLTIHGEVDFNWTGFALQGSGQLFESSKIVLQALLLSNAGRKLDVMSYVLLVMPLCFLVLGSLLFTLVFIHPLDHLKTPQWLDIVTWWPSLAVSATLAFGLNITIALFMKHCSAIGFILAGITKDAVIVLLGAFAMDEHISAVQAVGFFFQLSFIVVWSVMNIYPEKFEDGLLPGLLALREPDNMDKCLLVPEPLKESTFSDRYGASRPAEAYGVSRARTDSGCSEKSIGY